MLKELFQVNRYVVEPPLQSFRTVRICEAIEELFSNKPNPEPDSLRSFHNFINEFFVPGISFFAFLEVDIILEIAADIGVDIVFRQILEIQPVVRASAKLVLENWPQSTGDADFDIGGAGKISDDWQKVSRLAIEFIQAIDEETEFC